eukprot:3363950-Lingulodinium_polyedra.AAC.1
MGSLAPPPTQRALSSPHSHATTTPPGRQELVFGRSPPPATSLRAWAPGQHGADGARPRACWPCPTPSGGARIPRRVPPA